MFASKTPKRMLLLAAALASASALPLGGQNPPSSAPPVAGSPAPVIALVEPPPGGSVPSDKPVVLFRFAPGDSSDAIDARSFAIAVDGEDRTALFQVTATEAWGALAPPGDDGTLALAPGVRRVAARICSVRGVCAERAEHVMVVASDVAVGAAPIDRKRSFLELVLLALRKLIEP